MEETPYKERVCLSCQFWEKEKPEGNVGKCTQEKSSLYQARTEEGVRCQAWRIKVKKKSE